MRNTVDTKDKAILAELTKIAEDYFNTLDIEEGSYSSVDLCRMVLHVWGTLPIVR